MRKMKYKTVCIIPARAGSKRIINKNLKIIDKKPLLEHVINICKKSNIFSRIIVSTDSKKIEKLALGLNVEVPNLRPTKYSNDSATINSVIKYSFKKFGLKSYNFLFCVFATAILIEPKDLKAALKKIIDNRADHLLTISKYKNPIERFIYLQANKIKYFDKKKIIKKSQIPDKYFFDTGSFFIHNLISYKKKFDDKPLNSIPFILNEFKSLDLNDHNDLKKLKLLYKYKKNPNAFK